jgi:hypothetical protein
VSYVRSSIIVVWLVATMMLTSATVAASRHSSNGSIDAIHLSLLYELVAMNR